MIVVPIKEGENVDRALKKLKRKFEKIGVVRELRKRQKFTKKSVLAREQKKKAIYVQKLREKEEEQFFVSLFKKMLSLEIPLITFFMGKYLIKKFSTMITYTTDSQKQQIINCWKTAFPNDSEAFVDFYFEKKQQNENTLLYVKDDEIAASLQMLPYKMSYYKCSINTSYISGAMTMPRYRNQGLMKNLLIHAFREMRKRGDVLTTLIPQEPWLIDYYKKMGYTPCFEYELTEINPNDYPQIPDKMRFKEFELADFKGAYRFYKDIWMDKICVFRSRRLIFRL